MEEKDNPEGIFNTEENIKDNFNNIKPLINEPYSYDNIINNPIIKPIAETDKSNQDLQDMIDKKLHDSNRDKRWINETIIDVPRYNESPFVARLIKISQGFDDVIKLQDLKNRNLENCIKEMVEIIKDKYGVKIDEEFESGGIEPETIIPEVSYEEYLNNLIKSSNKNISRISLKIKQNLDEDHIDKDDRIKFEDACRKYYTEDTNKQNKEILTKILKMEL